MPVFVFQTAVLAILVSLILWGLAGLRVFDTGWPMAANPIAYLIIKVVLFCFASMTIRECWHVVMGAQMLLIVQKRITDHGGNAKDKEQKRC